jgi:hypothetical protein
MSKFIKKDFFKIKVITYEELVSNFKLVKTLSPDKYDVNICQNCHSVSSLELETWKSDPWTAFRYCNLCKHATLFIFCDPMGGKCNDTIEIYKEHE